MKKVNGFLLLVCLLCVVAACNNNAETNTTVTKDSVTVRDSMHNEPSDPAKPPVQNAPF